MLDVDCTPPTSVCEQEASWLGGHRFRNDEPISKPHRPYKLSRSLLGPYLCIAVIYIGSGVVEGNVQELEPSLHLRLSKL